MADVGYGSNERPTAWVANPYSDGIGLPVGRAMANGQTLALITHIYGYAAGKYAALSGRMYLGASYTGVFSIPKGDSALGTGYVACETKVLVSGGTARAQHAFGSGAVTFGRSAAGGTVYSASDGGYSQVGVLGGAYRYTQAPTAPRSLAATNIKATEADLSFVVPELNGDSAITGYAIQVDTDPLFGSPETILQTALTKKLTGLTPGVDYHVRVAGRNEPTTLAGTYGPWSAPITLTTLSGAYVGDGSTFAAGEVFVGDGTNWLPAEVYISDGTTFNPAS